MDELVFTYSSMNSGKSLSLLTKNFTLKEKGFRTVLMKPSIDTRTENTISTRLGISESCVLLSETDLPSSKILKSDNRKPDFIFIDEAQFLSKEQVLDLCGLVDNWKITVFCYGLKLDWKGNFFSGSEELFKLADKLEPLENICRYNKGAPAFFHIKKNTQNNSSIEIGEENLYESVSRKKWLEWNEKNAGN